MRLGEDDRCDRKGEMFSIVSPANHKGDADFVGARNILIKLSLGGKCPPICNVFLDTQTALSASTMSANKYLNMGEVQILQRLWRI